MIEFEDHPWVQAAKAMQMAPLPSIASFNMITVTDPASDEPVPHVLLTMGTPAGVTTVFISQEQFKAMMGQGNDILKIWEESKSKITLATVTDMKRETNAMKNLNDKFRP